MKKATILLFICLSFSLQAKEILPKGCKPFVIDKRFVSIPKGKVRLLAFHNLTKTDLWLTVENASDLTGHLQNNAWSLLKTNRKSIKINCIESKPGHEQQVSCQSALSVCEWPILSKRREKEAFWIGQNMPLSPLIAYAARKGWMSSPGIKNKF